MPEKKPCEYCDSTKTAKDNESCTHCGAPRLRAPEQKPKKLVCVRCRRNEARNGSNYCDPCWDDLTASGAPPETPFGL